MQRFKYDEENIPRVWNMQTRCVKELMIVEKQGECLSLTVNLT